MPVLGIFTIVLDVEQKIDISEVREYPDLFCSQFRQLQY
jgi:hypothetical protein